MRTPPASLTLAAVFLLTCQLSGASTSPDDASGDGSVAPYREVNLTVPTGSTGGTASLGITVPTKAGDHALASPADVYEHVSKGWEVLVESNQAGLVDPKQMGKVEDVPLSTEEAWHHYRASQTGVVDSGRFLATFTMVPSVQTGGSRLFLAAAAGDARLVQALLTQEDAVDVNEQKKTDGNTALHAAATTCQPETMAVLLAHGALPTLVGHSGASPLMMAATIGCVDGIRAILAHAKAESGVESAAYKEVVDQRHPFAGNTALHFAAEMGRDEAVLALCEGGADILSRKAKTGGTALHTAADTNQTGAVDALLGRCVDLRVARTVAADAPGFADAAAGARTSYLSMLMMEDTTPLYLAAQRGLHQIVKVIAGYGANLDYVMPTGKFHGSLQRVGGGASGGSDGEEAVSYGEKNTEIGNGATAIHAAAENGHPETVRTLLALGARQLPTMQRTSPLLTAVQYDHPEIAQDLLEAMTDADEAACYDGDDGDLVTPAGGATPLYEAAGRGTRFAKLVSTLFARRPAYARAQLLYRVPRDGGGRGSSVVPFVDPLSHALARGNAPLAVEMLRGGGGAAQLWAAGASGFPTAAALRDGYAVATLEGRSVECLNVVLAVEPRDGAAAAGKNKNRINRRLFGGSQTMLHRAIAGRAGVPVVRTLIDEFAADVRARVGDATKASCAHVAVAAGDAEVLRVVLAAADKAGEAMMARALAGRGLGWATPLHLAARAGDAKVMEVLLRHPEGVKGFDVALHKSGATPLLEAVAGGHAKMAEMLLAGGARAGVKAEGGASLLHLAVAAGNGELCALLEKQQGLSYDAVDDAGATPLVAALQTWWRGDAGGAGRRGPSAEVVRRVVSRTDVARRTRASGFGALHAAVLGGAPVGVLRLLREAGAPLGTEADAEATPTMLAAAAQLPAHAAFLLEQGDAARNGVSTALHAAVDGLEAAAAAGQGQGQGQRWYCDVCEVLLKAGLDINSEDSSGRRVDYQVRAAMRSEAKEGGVKEKEEEGGAAAAAASKPGSRATEQKQKFREAQRQRQQAESGSGSGSGEDEL